MDNTKSLQEWTQVVRGQMSHLTKAQAGVLAMWSFGIVMAGTCGLNTVSAVLAVFCGQKEATLRQRLREWYFEQEAKRGAQRCELEVQHSFAALLGWVLSWWSAQEWQLAIAMDATQLKDIFVVLAISVVYRGCAIPVAWKVLPAQQKKGWKEEWLALFAALEGVVPANWQVIVLADRGLYAPWLFQAIRKRGWHPFLRITQAGKYRLESSSQWYWLRDLVARSAGNWSGRVVCFKTRPLKATLLLRQEPDQAEAWLVVTDLAPEQANVCWYGMRAWIECGFKHLKRGGWQWHKTRISDPERASRLWLALAVATLWAVSVGGEADDTLPASSLESLPATHVARLRRKHPTQPRLLSCFRRGMITIWILVLTNDSLPLATFSPDPWPLS